MSHRLKTLIDVATEAKSFLRAIPGSPAALRLANRIDAILDPNYNKETKIHRVTITTMPTESFEVVAFLGAEAVYEGAEAEYSYAHK